MSAETNALSWSVYSLMLGMSTPHATDPDAPSRTTYDGWSKVWLFSVVPITLKIVVSLGKSTPHANDAWSLRMIRSLPGSVSNEKAWKPR